MYSRKAPSLLLHSCPETEENQRGACQKAERERFVKNNPGEENGSQRVDIDPIRTSYCTEARHTLIPGQVAQDRGDTTEKEQIAKDGRMQQ